MCITAWVTAIKYNSRIVALISCSGVCVTKQKSRFKRGLVFRGSSSGENGGAVGEGSGSVIGILVVIMG